METKICTKCKDPKDIEQFARKSINGKLRNSWCKKCVNINSRKNYDKVETINRSKRHIKRNREFVSEYLSIHPCVDCGESDIIVLDFDHITGTKRDSVSRMIRNGVSLETLQKEIDKCVVRCSNDHRRKTYKQRKIGT